MSNYIYALCRTNGGKDNRERFETTTSNYLFAHTSNGEKHIIYRPLFTKASNHESEYLQTKSKRRKRADLTLTRIHMQSYLHKRHMTIIQSREERQEELRRKKSMERVVDSLPPSPHSPMELCRGPYILGGWGEWERLAVEW